MMEVNCNLRLERIYVDGESCLKACRLVHGTLETPDYRAGERFTFIGSACNNWYSIALDKWGSKVYVPSKEHQYYKKVDECL